MSAAIDQLLNDALAFHRAGRLADAQALYNRVLAIEPRHVDALHLLGVLVSQQGRPQEGAELIGRAIDVDPKPMYRANMVRSLIAAGRLDDAGKLLQELSLGPSDEQALWQMHIEALHQANRFADAIAAAREVVRRHPDSAAAYGNLGICLMAAGDAAAAADAHARAAEIMPQAAPFHTNLAPALTSLGKLDEAIAACRRAIACDANFAIAHNNRGVALRKRGDLADAKSSFDAAIAIAPSFADAHFNLAIVLLEAGDYESAWREYEWRWRRPDFGDGRPEMRALWAGDDLRGRTLLVQAEQGFGDVLQFARYLPLLRGRGGKIVLLCQDELRELLSSVEGPDEVVGYSGVIPPCDVYAPLMSLPLILQTGGTIPPTPYLSADAYLAAKWREKLSAHGPAPRIGIAWAGNPDQDEANLKRIPFELLAGALRGLDATFVSLQKGSFARDLSATRQGIRIIDLSAQLSDFAQTAAVIANLDLVITIDTAVAHLAAAMGKPTWVLLYAGTDYRWPRGGTSPWYPDARLFRQRQFGDWSLVLNELDAALRQFRA